MLKISPLFKKNTNFTGKFSGYYFYVNLNIWEDFQIFNSVPLIYENVFQGKQHKNKNE